MLPEDYRMIETCRSVFKCFNVNFGLLKTIYIYICVCVCVCVCVCAFVGVLLK